MTKTVKLRTDTRNFDRIVDIADTAVYENYMSAVLTGMDFIDSMLDAITEHYNPNRALHMSHVITYVVDQLMLIVVDPEHVSDVYRVTKTICDSPIVVEYFNKLLTMISRLLTKETSLVSISLTKKGKRRGTFVEVCIAPKNTLEYI
jgi:hypothetical protein